MAPFKTVIVDALFPERCLACGGEPERRDAWLCRSCHSRIQPRWEVFCPICRAHPTRCALKRSHAPAALESISALLRYSEPSVRSLIHGFKYSRIKSLAAIWTGLAERSRLDILRLSADAIIPVPLHPRKLRERGFNQSEIIARIIGKLTRIPVNTKLLVRRRTTEPQMSMRTIQKRIRNIRGAFDCTAAASGRFIIVDDVCTTGATLEEAARTLRYAGARQAAGFVLAQD